ncbi:MAG: hypothetical protein V1792_14190 [Pseudomonadota bacterium]
MNLSKLKRRQWGFFTVGTTLWIGFVYFMPSRLAFPWDALNILLGLFSPLFWYKALDLHHTFAHGGEGESINAPGAHHRTAVRMVYLALGAVSWGIFLYNIPSPRFPPYEVLIPPDVLAVLRGILGFLSLILWSAAAYLNLYDNSLWRSLLRTESPGHEREPQSKKVPSRFGKFVLFSSWIVWGTFISLVLDGLHGLSWEIYRLTSYTSLFLLLGALYLSIKSKHVSRTECSIPATGR